MKVVIMTLILSGSILFADLSTCKNFDLNVTTQLPDYIIPEHYNVKLDLTTIEKGSYNGTCYIRIRLDRPTRNISFHAQRSQINTYLFVLNKINSSSSYKPTSYKNNTNHTVSIYFDDELSSGHYILKILFTTSLYNDKEDVFNTFYLNKERSIWLLGVSFQTIGARRIFPCWDEPTFKAIFNISVKHLSKHRVLSNMPVRMPTMRYYYITHFEETPLIPPYLVTIVISNFPRIPVKRINFQCRLQTALHLRYAKMFIENITLHLESEWKRCKELAKVDHVAIPGFYQESMNKLGLVFYREAALIHDEKLDPVIRKIDVARLAGRAVVRQCLDNSVNPTSWSHLWLKEGILTLYAAETINKMFPEFRIWDLFVVQVRQESLRLDTDFIMKPLMSEASATEIISHLSLSCYIKAPAILRMLQHVLGHNVFWNGIEIFLNNPKYKSSSNFDDFWTATQTALNNSNSIYKVNIKDKMNSWIQLKHYPVLKVTKYDLLHVEIWQQYITLSDTLEIPVTFTTQDYCNFNDTSPYLKFARVVFPLWISAIGNKLPSNPNEWMIFNIQQAGYYRVNYDATYLDRIVHYLRTSDEYTKIHVLNRAQIIDDAFHFLMNNRLPLFTFLELTKYLQRETDFIAWYPMFKALEYMSSFFFFETSVRIKINMRDILHELLKNITYTEKSDEKPNDLIKCLRQEAAKWACVLGDNNCKSNATFKLTQHLNDTERLSPEWKKWAYCNGIANVRLDIFDTRINKTDKKLLESCSTSHYIIQNYLNIIVNESENCDSKMLDCENVSVQPKDRVNSFLLTVARHAKDNEVLEYIFKNFEKLKPREVSMHVVLITIINHVQSKEQFDKVLEFVEDYRKEVTEIRYININPKLDIPLQELHRKIDEVVNRIVNYIDVTILNIKQKIKARLSEIMSQLNYFKNLMPH